MSDDTVGPERSTLNQIRSDFESKGYQFIMEPRGEQLPEFLQSYQPDALAIGQDGIDKVIIEVKRNAVRGVKVPVAELNLELASKDGWRYLLVYVGQDPSDIIDLSRPQKSQVDSAIKEVRDLQRSGYMKAAMLEGWSLLEALSRRIYPSDIRVSLRPLSSVTVVERLAMDGLINDGDARRLRALGSIRNAMAHGDLNVRVSEDDLGYLLDRVEAVNANVTA